MVQAISTSCVPATVFAASNCSRAMGFRTRFSSLDSAVAHVSGAGVAVARDVTRSSRARRSDERAVISRALASFLQHVGILKPEFYQAGEKVFDEKFKELLARYSQLTNTGGGISIPKVNVPAVPSVAANVKVPSVSLWGKKEPAKVRARRRPSPRAC